MNHTQRNVSRTLVTISECCHHYSSVACMNAEKNGVTAQPIVSTSCKRLLLCSVFTVNPLLRRRMEFRSRYSVQCGHIWTQLLSSLLSKAAISEDLFKPVCKAGIII